MSEIAIKLATRIRTQLNRRLDWLPPSGTENPLSYDTESRHRLRIGLIFLYVCSAAAYFGWRLTVFNPDAPVYSAVFYAAELFSSVICFVLSFTGWRRLQRRPPRRPQDGLTVDVFVTAYDEPANVIRRTVLAAINLDYPHHTWLLDDGRRSELKSLARELGCRYLTRPNNQGAKAGNLNNALTFAKGDFVAVFDADHVAQCNFLVKLLGYFRDEKVSLVQTPQDFFNTNAFQYYSGRQSRLFWHDMSEFHYVGQPGRDHWNAVTFCGCSAILRRSALDAIGGFPEETVTEDMHASVRMQKLGYTHVYHAEPLAFGIAPVGLADYLRQRLRWGEGNMQVCRAERIPFTEGLNWQQRFSYGSLSWLYWASWQRLAYYSAPIVLLFLQIPPIWSDPATFAAFFAPYMLLTYVVFEEVTRGHGRFFASEQSGMAQLLAGLVATTTGFRKNIRFRVASKKLTSQTPILLLMPQIVILSLSVSGVLYALYGYLVGPPLGMALWITVMVASLALFNAFIASLVIRNAVRVARLSDPEYFHPVPLPARLECPSGPSTLAAIEKISVDGFDCRVSRCPELALGTRLMAHIFLPGWTLNCPVQITKIETKTAKTVRLSAQFRWDSKHDRDPLDQTLHAGRWYRPLIGYRESVRTPYDCLRDLISTGSLKRPEHIHWDPAICTWLKRKQTRSSLCYLCSGHSKTHQNPVLLAFEPFERGSILTVTRPMHDRSADMIIEIGARISGLLQDEEALSVAGSEMYLIQEVVAGQAVNSISEIEVQIVEPIQIKQGALQFDYASLKKHT